MVAALLITLREGLEAALVVGIVLGVLRKLGQADRSKPVWAGVLAAAMVSIVAGLALNALGVAFEGRGEEIFEGIAMLLAAVVLTWMIFWMQRQGRHIQTELEKDVRQAVTTRNTWALFSLAFVAVVREGIETVLFLTAASFDATAVETLVGGGLGLAIAVVLGWVIFIAGKRLNVRTFFRVTSALLILFAAGLAAHGVHELQEAALLPTINEHVWDVNHILDEGSTVGTFLKALFGYNGNPSLLEVITYAAYFIIVGAFRTGRQAPLASAPAETEPQSGPVGARDGLRHASGH
jgi:high-affinity iron transporter